VRHKKFPNGNFQQRILSFFFNIYCLQDIEIYSLMSMLQAKLQPAQINLFCVILSLCKYFTTVEVETVNKHTSLLHCGIIATFKKGL